MLAMSGWRMAKLAFDILDPKTGKAKRMILILGLDWASHYLVGASLAFT
jgi:hypothetical protein